MKKTVNFWILPIWLAAGVAAAQALPASSAQLLVKARSGVPDLSCAQAPRRTSSPPAQDADPLEIPDEEQVRDQLTPGGAMPMRGTVTASDTWKGFEGRSGKAFKVAIWGDSHQAAGFFSGELLRLLQWPAEAVGQWIIPATMNRPGIRLGLRKSCTSEHWRYEPAYFMSDAAAEPGPGLVSMNAVQPGALLAWDVRNANGAADKDRVRILYQQTALPIRLGVTVDGGGEQVLTLRGEVGGAALDLSGDGPLSVITVRLLEGSFRFQGLELPILDSTRLVLDVFGYPGATAAAWRRAKPDQLKKWWGDDGYDMVVLAFGTNEGNVRPFDAAVYFQMLKSSVVAWREQFPNAACVLIGPGDRGVLIRRSENLKAKKSSKVNQGAKTKQKLSQSQSNPAKVRARSANPVAEPLTGKGASQDLFKYTRIHEEIGAMQEKLATEHGCKYWSMLDAMGGSGGAYRWARNNPPWMAKDLIHFTVPGYQRLAQSFAEDVGWQKSLLPRAP